MKTKSKALSRSLAGNGDTERALVDCVRLTAKIQSEGGDYLIGKAKIQNRLIGQLHYIATLGF